MIGIPHELVEWFRTLVSPPDARAFVFSDIDRQIPAETAAWPDESLWGAVARGTPTEAQVAEIMRLLKPGAHLVLISPDDDPTGHVGTCRVEDGGFEIRDSVLIVDESKDFHYVPKASRAEREAGCAGIVPRKRDESRNEGNPGGDNLRNRGAGAVRNFHPTVKAVGLMERLLTDVPKDKGPVLDCFMGSGSTGIACVKTGHDFVGIDMDSDYVGLATARIRYWDQELNPFAGAVVETEQEPEVEPLESLDEIFGW